MKKILIMVMLVGLGLSYSCKKAEKKEEPKPTQPAPEPPKPGPVTAQPGQEPEGKIIVPEAFYKFEVDRLSLLKDHKSKFQALLKSAKAKDDALIDKVIASNKAIVADFIALTDKDGVKAEDYKKTTGDPGAQKANQDYIAKHPEISEKMKKLQEDVVSIEQGINTEVQRLQITQEDMIKRANPQGAPGQPQEAPKPGSAPEKAPAPPASPSK